MLLPVSPYVFCSEVFGLALTAAPARFQHYLPSAMVPHEWSFLYFAAVQVVVGGKVRVASATARDIRASCDWLTWTYYMWRRDEANSMRIQ